MPAGKIFLSQPRSRSMISKNQAKVVRQIANKQIKKAGEVKVKDTALFATPSLTGTITQLNNIIQGTANSQRVGNEIFMKNLWIATEMIGADSSNIVRHIVFLWHDNTVPLATSILENSGTLTSNVMSAYKYDNRRVFTILHDKVFTLQANTGSGTGTFNKFHRIKAMKIGRKSLYDGPLGTDYGRRNVLYSLVLADSAVVTHPQVQVYYRLRYTDL